MFLRFAFVSIVVAALVFGCGEEKKDLFSEAEQLREGGQYKLAIASLSGIAKQYRDSRDTVITALRKTGDIYLKDLGDYAEAMGIYNEISSRYPESPILKDIATNTISELEKVAAEKSGDRDEVIKIHRVIGDLYAGYLGDFQGACDTYRKVIGIYPDDPIVPMLQFQIGYTMANHMQAYQEARDVYKKFLKEFPDHELAASVEAELSMLDSREAGKTEEEALNEFLKKKTGQ